VPHLLEKLRNKVGDIGSILVWHESFERSRNNEMAEKYPEYKGFIESMNGRLYDLELIFKGIIKDNHKAKYSDYRFKGNSSIKNILPILVPDLKYEEINIQTGSEAMDSISDLLEGKTDDPVSLEEDLKCYCKLDTLAMVKIFDALKILYK